MNQIKRHYSVYFEDFGDGTPHGLFEFTIFIMPAMNDRYFVVHSIWSVELGREMQIDDFTYKQQTTFMNRLADFCQKVVKERRQIEAELIAERRKKTMVKKGKWRPDT